MSDGHMSDGPAETKADVLSAVGDGLGPVGEATGAAPPRPVGRWLARVKYDPDQGFREEDMMVSASEYSRRFVIPRGPGADTFEVTIPGSTRTYIPKDVEGQILEYTAEGNRWRPRRINSADELKQFHESDAGKTKRLLEQYGFDSVDPPLTGAQPADHLIGQEYIPIGPGPFYKQLYWFDYLKMHATAFAQTNHSALAAAAIKIMMRFVLGRGISFHIKHPAAAAVWDEFITRVNYRDKLRQMARDLPWQGELLIRFYEHARGYTSIRVLDPSTCWEKVTDPEDLEKCFYYHFQWACLDGQTRIPLLDGTEVAIERLAERGVSRKNPLWVYSYDEKTGRVVPGKATACIKQGRKRCVEVELDNGEKIIASHDHPFLRRDGKYIWAEKLKPGDRLMPLYRGSDYEKVWHPGIGRWQYTHDAVVAVHGPKPDGSITHHLDLDKRNNDPENLAYVPWAVHNSEHSRGRWSNPEYAEQRVHFLRRVSENMKQMWRDGKFDHLCGPRPRRWRRSIAKAIRASWKDPEIRAKRVKKLRASWASPTVRAERVERMLAGRLKNKRIMPPHDERGRFRLKNHAVAAVRPAGTRIVYDLHVEKYHNFAVQGYVFTHNTPYQLYVKDDIPSSRYLIQQIPATNIHHTTINISSQEKRGRSDLLPAMPWIKRFNDFYDGQTVKAVLEANLVFKIKIKGDQADADAFLTNPALTELPPPGGVWIENEAVDLQATSATLTAGRGSTGIGQQLASIVAASMNLPSEYFNVESAGPARATALVRTDPAVKTIEDRQQLMREINEAIYEHVLACAYAAGRLPKEAAREEPEIVPDEGTFGMDRDEQDRTVVTARALRGVAR